MFSQSITYGKAFQLDQQDYDSLATKISDFSTFQLHPFILKSDLEYTISPTPSIVLNVGNDSIALQLQKSSLASTGAMINIHGDSSNVLIDLISSDVYSGFVGGDTNQVASFIVREDDLFGYYQKNGEMWFVSKLIKLIDSQNSAAQTTFVKFKDISNFNLGCATDVSSETPPLENPSSTERSDGDVWHFEIAYDVDYAMYSKFNQQGQEPAEERIRKYLEEVTMSLQGIYQQVVPLYFHIVDINIWSTSAQPFTHSGNIQSHWNQGKNWWNGNKECITRDAVTLLTGHTGISQAGYVGTNGVHSICSTPPTWGCIIEPYNVVKHRDMITLTARSVAHELAHNFGQQQHSCDCNIMWAGQTTSICDYENCTQIFSTWDLQTYGIIERRFENIYELCNPSNQTLYIDSDVCLRDAPPVDLDFNLHLEADEVIITTESVICPGEEFNARFFNGYDPNGSIQWELGPSLEYASDQPTSNKSRNVLASASSCCYPFDTWIKVTFNHNCGGPFTYIRKIRVNSTFGLNGVYAGPSSGEGSIDTINTVNFVIPGSYDIRLENQSAIYTWTQTIGTNPPTTLPYTSYGFSFGIQSGQSISFKAKTINSCGDEMERTFSFYTPMFRMASNSTDSEVAEVLVYPNPSSGKFNILTKIASNEIGLNYKGLLFDIQGRLIRNFIITVGEEQEIDLSNFPSGIYHLQIVKNDGTVSFKLEKI